MTNESVCIVLSAGLGGGRRKRIRRRNRRREDSGRQTYISEDKQPLQQPDSFHNCCNAVALSPMDTMQSDVFQNYSKVH